MTSSVYSYIFTYISPKRRMKWSANKRKNHATSPTAPECHKLELCKAVDRQKFRWIVPELFAMHIVYQNLHIWKSEQISTMTVQKTHGKFLIVQMLRLMHSPIRVATPRSFCVHKAYVSSQSEVLCRTSRVW